jgi:predicted RND superfamily exporter protein
LPTLRSIYESTVLGRPVATLVVVALFTLSLGWYAQYFSLDASAESLTLERDESLDYYRYVRARYGSDDYLLITYTPQAELFSDAALDDIRALRDALRALPNVDSVTSILDVPLVMSPPVDLRDIDTGVRYLEDENTERRLAREELVTSPLYRNLLISDDATTTVIRVDMRDDPEYRAMRNQRDALREKKITAGLTTDESRALDDISTRYDNRTRELLAQQAGDIAAVRGVMDGHRDNAELFLGGMPMIVADSMDFIRSDLVTFGAGVFAFLVIILASSFKRWRWVLLPLMTCIITSVSMIGLLGRLDWRVTVVSSNFVALILILCLALTLHIIVRYREIHERNPDASQMALVSKTVRRIVEPCLYTALTTIVAFGSLLVSGIRPVIDFGWMMSIGIVIAFIASFTFFPAALMLLEPGKPRSRNDITASITRFFANLIYRHGKTTLGVFLVLFLVGFTGTTRLTVENRFIDYYKESTEIYRGMELIDRQLGGTTPLDVIIDAPPETGAPDEPDLDDDYEDEFEDIYADETDAEAGITARSYWLNDRQLPVVEALHDYLDNLSDTGKVISLATFARILEQLDEDVLADNFTMSVVYEKLPDTVRDTLISPYLSEDGNQLRFGVRVFESNTELQRNVLLETIGDNLGDAVGIDDSQIHLSGMLILYNNMLQSLFRSQIMTLGAVFVAIMFMFLVLFRSVKIAAIAIIPNLFSACLVLGLMGWAGIPLDLMTITIAAITVGIAVDDTIHYVHRFQYEFEQDRDYWAAVFRCHRSIGRAIYYTSVTIMLGFSILALSQFMPTIYFGVLTSFAMLVALLGDITLLPLLLVKFRAVGEPANGHAGAPG